MLAIPSAAEAVGATTYYVSPTGSDSNSGTSPSAPIQTLGRASNLPLAPGDQVLLQRGASFSGKLAIWRSGTAGSPITIGAYGSGSKPVVKAHAFCRPDLSGREQESSGRFPAHLSSASAR